MRFLRGYLFLSAFVIAPVVQSATFTHRGYTVNDQTRIVSNGSLEWLSWSVTKGQSIEQALAEYKSGGWKLASNIQMYDLLSDLTSVQFADDENIAQIDRENATSEDVIAFGKLFGVTSSSYSNSYYDSYDKRFSHALFGNDGDDDGLYNIAYVMLDREDSRRRVCGFTACHTEVSTSIATSAFSSEDNFDLAYKSSISGVALVREIDSVSAVPIPPAAFLFGPALLGFLGLRRNKPRLIPNGITSQSHAL